MVKPSCIVFGCKWTSAKDVTYFKFPASRTLRKKWCEAVNARGRPAPDAAVCSRHFLRTDYQHVKGKARLKAKVVPSVFTVETNNIKESKNIPKSKKAKSDLKTNENNEENNIESNKKTNSNETEEKAERDGDIPHDKDSRTDVKDKNSLNNDNNKVQDKNEMEKDKVNENGESEKRNGEERVQDCAKEKEDGTEDTKSNESSVSAASIDSLEKPLQSTPQTPAGPPDIDKPEDIEELLTNYTIKQNNIHKPPDTVNVEQKEDVIEITVEPDDCYDLMFPDREKDPVFIELAVGQDCAADKADCLMVLESVQVDVDPGALMLDHDHEHDADADVDDEIHSVHDDDPQEIKGDPISLLTSSDEDDVIIEEPHIDTVEVSDETDEDDMPLVKLVKKKKKERKDKKKPKSTRIEDNIGKMMWGIYEYYCVECHFRTMSRTEYKRHTQEHKKNVLLMCQLCGYMTSSVSQLRRHEKQHKEDKKYQCHLCDYRAKHNMSLIYHLKSHNVSQKSFKCNKCGLRADGETEALRHVMLCNDVTDKRHACDDCSYRTNKLSDMKRHRARRHPGSKDVSVSEVKKHRCSECNYRTDRASDLRRHLASRHPDTGPDSDCSS